MKKKTQEVREYAKNKNQLVESMNLEEIEKGLNKKSKEFKDQGSKIYKQV